MAANDKVVFVFVPYARHSKKRHAVTIRKAHLVVHVHEALEVNRRHQIESALTDQRGIMWARFTDKRPHLMMVEYDSDITNSFSILQAVKGQNVHAELIGPI